MRLTGRTWFYNADGSFGGWVDAQRISDTANGDGMLFVDKQQRVFAVSKGYVVTEVKQFLWPDASTAEPVRLYPDARVGFFKRGADLCFASW